MMMFAHSSAQEVPVIDRVPLAIEDPLDSGLLSSGLRIVAEM
jgi:hypothetical protein